VRNVDADPAAIEALGYLHRCTAATEGIEDKIAFVGTGFDDAFEEGFGLLGGVAEIFFSSSAIDVVPIVLKCDTWHFICELDKTWHTRLTMNYVTRLVKGRNILTRIRPETTVIRRDTFVFPSSLRGEIFIFKISVPTLLTPFPSFNPPKKFGVPSRTCGCQVSFFVMSAFSIDMFVFGREVLLRVWRIDDIPNI
jgi:hypothetical protein